MRPRLADTLVSLAISVGAVAVALAISMLIIALSGAPPVAAARAMWEGAFGSGSQFAGTLAKMIPLMLVAMGWVLAFSTKRINIGFEGQILAGGIAAAFIGLHFGGLPTAIHLPLAVLGGLLAGGLYAGVAAWLWARRSVNEIISTLLLNLVAIQLVSWLVRGPMQEPTRQFPQTRPMTTTGLWPRMVANTSLSWDLLLAFFIVLCVAFVLKRTTIGYRLRLTGASEEASRYAGLQTKRITVLALIASGALAGVAGSSLILAGESNVMTDNFSANYGFDGIAVALVARNSPAGVIPAALLFAALRQGGGLMQAKVGVSSALVYITQGIVILLVVGAGFLTDRLRSVRVDAGESGADAAASRMTVAKAV